MRTTQATDHSIKLVSAGALCAGVTVGDLTRKTRQLTCSEYQAARADGSIDPRYVFHTVESDEYYFFTRIIGSDAGWHINHSETPNCTLRHDGVIVTLRSVGMGEHLTCNYHAVRGGAGVNQAPDPRGVLAQFSDWDSTKGLVEVWRSCRHILLGRHMELDSTWAQTITWGNHSR